MFDTQIDPSRKSIPSWIILQEAATQVWARREHFGKLMLMPMAATVIVGYCQSLWSQSNTEEQPLVQIFAEAVFELAAYGIISALFAIGIHRSVLLGERASSSRWFLQVGKRERVFMGWSFLIGGGMLGIVAIGTTLIGTLEAPFNLWCSNLFNHMEQTYPWLENIGQTILIALGGFTIGFLVSYFSARTSLILPAIALDRPQNLEWAWTISRPHTMRLAFLVGAIPIASLLLQTLGSIWISELLWELAYQVLSAFVYCVLLILEITILSLSYRWITDSAPTTQPPTIVEQIS